MRISDWSSDVCSSDLTCWAADQHGPRAERQRLEDGCSAPDAAIDVDFRPAFGADRHRRQRIDDIHGVIELVSAVIGDEQARSTRIYTHTTYVAAKNSFAANKQYSLAAEPHQTDDT